MAKGIKGITVEIGGDTAPLDKALGDVNKRSRSLQVELRQVEKLLKFDPSNTELLAQKQQILSQSIGTTEEKLNALKAAQQQVQKQFERGEVTEEQYRALTREVVKTEQELTNLKSAAETSKNALESQTKSVNDASVAQSKHNEEIEEANEKLNEYGEKIKGASKKIGIGIAAIGTAAITTSGYALKISTEFDQAFNTLITRTGASKDEFDSLNEAMENVYKNNFGESIEDVAQSMATVKVYTNLTGEELQKATENAILLRDTFEFEVNESTRAAKMLMDQFGVSSDEAYNLIVQGAQAGLDKNGDLLDTINEYSVHFKQLGIDSEEMFNMLVNGAAEGTFSVDKLGDAVKEFGIRVKDGTADNAFKELGFNVDETTLKFAKGGDTAKSALNEVTKALFELEDPVQQNILGVEMFGTMWEDLGAEGIQSLMDMQWEIDKTNSALENINNQKYDDIGAALAGLGRTLEVDVVEPLGEELKPVVEEVIDVVQSNSSEITDILSTIVSSIGDFVGFIVNNGPTILSVISGIGVGFLTWKVTSMILGIVSGIQGMIGTLKTLELANSGVTLSQKALNLSMLANPITIIVGLIAGLVAAIVVLWNTNEGFRNTVISAWENIKQSASDCWGVVCNFFTETIPNAWNVCISFLQGIPNWFSNLWTLTMDTFNQWGTNVSTFFTTTIPQWISNIVTWFNELPYKIGFALGTALANIVNWGVNTWSYLTTNVPIWINGVSTWFSQLPGKIWSWLSNAIQKVISWGTQTYNNAMNYANNAINGIISYFSQLPGRLWTWLSNAIQKIVQMGSDMVNRGKTAASNTVTAIANGFTSLPGKMLNIGKSAVEGIWKGITSMTGWIKDKISGFCSGIVSGFKSALKINSPAKVMYPVGGGIVEGIDVGANNEMPNLTRNIKDNIDDLVNDVSEVDPSVVQTISRSNDSLKLIDSSSIDYDKLTSSFIRAIKTIDFNFNVDGRNLTRTIAKYQDEFKNYSYRKPLTD